MSYLENMFDQLDGHMTLDMNTSINSPNRTAELRDESIGSFSVRILFVGINIYFTFYRARNSRGFKTQYQKPRIEK
jgi:hypothetical protein